MVDDEELDGRFFRLDLIRTESSSAGPPGYVFGEMRLETLCANMTETP
jgi:hypothetical protein